MKRFEKGTESFVNKAQSQNLFLFYLFGVFLKISPEIFVCQCRRRERKAEMAFRGECRLSSFASCVFLSRARANPQDAFSARENTQISSF